MSIRSKLTIALLALALIPLSFVSFLTFQHYKNSMETIRLSQLRDIAVFKADKIETYFASLKAELNITQGLYNIKKNLPVLIRFSHEPANEEFLASKKMLDEQMRQMQSVLVLSDIMLVNPDGKVVYSSNPEHYSKDFLHPVSGCGKKTFGEWKSRLAFSDIFFNEKEGDRPALLAGAPLFDSQGDFVGVVVFEVDMAPVYHLVEDRTGLGVTGETLVGKRAGDQIVYLTPLRHEQGVPLAKRIDIGGIIGGPMQKAVRGETGAGQLIDYRGRRVIAAWRYISSLGWGVVAKIDASEAFAEALELRNFALWILAIVFGVGGITALSLARSISLPIRRLSKGAEIIGRGNLDYKVGTDLNDEIGQLSRSFDKMTRDLKMITASRDELNREISERKEAEEALKRSNESLEQFAYVASHDLQEPLRVMSSYSQLLEKRYKSKFDQDADDFIGFIVDAASRMQRLITDLLAYSRVGRKDFAPTEVDFNEVVKKVIYGMKSTIESAGGEVTHDNLPVLAAHETSIMQVFQNLVSNALKFRSESAPRIHISAKKDDGAWVFSVADNGLGIEPQYHERIFQIFQRLHSRDKYSGTGIGLSICKKIVTNYGGKMWVESELGKGSIFYFTIPI